MPAGLAAEPVTLPAAVRRSPRSQPRLAQERSHQAVGIERTHVGEVRLQRVGERAGAQSHPRGREELHRAPAVVSVAAGSVRAELLRDRAHERGGQLQRVQLGEDLEV